MLHFQGFLIGFTLEFSGTINCTIFQCFKRSLCDLLVYCYVSASCKYTDSCFNLRSKWAILTWIILGGRTFCWAQICFVHVQAVVMAECSSAESKVAVARLGWDQSYKNPCRKWASSVEYVNIWMLYPWGFLYLWGTHEAFVSEYSNTS